MIAALRRRVDPALLRYGLTGGAAAAVDLGGFVLLRPLIGDVLAAAAASFALAMVVNYALSTAFAFHAAPSWRRFALFAAFALAGLCMNAGVTVAAATLFVAPDWLAKTTGIGVAFFFNFAANRFVVFRAASGVAAP